MISSAWFHGSIVAVGVVCHKPWGIKIFALQAPPMFEVPLICLPEYNIPRNLGGGRFFSWRFLFFDWSLSKHSVCQIFGIYLVVATTTFYPRISFLL